MSSFPKSHQTMFVAHLKRNPGFKTREAFYEYWDKHGALAAPMLKAFGGMNYQQIQVGGTVIPNQPNPQTKATTSQPIEFDGIAIFTLAGDADVDGFLSALAGTSKSTDPKMQEQVRYNMEVIKPDELELLDANAPGMGVLSVIVGPVLRYNLEDGSYHGPTDPE